MSDKDLILFRAGVEVEMRKRDLAFSVGELGEKLAIEYFRETPGLPKLQSAPRGTKCVDALSRNGDRYSIKTICNAKKTGTNYPDPDRDKQLFEYLLIVRLREDWSLASIHQVPWDKFVVIRSWDKRMNAWYIGCSAKNLSVATTVFTSQPTAAPSQLELPHPHGPAVSTPSPPPP
jgi:hypothetical protein